MTGIGKTLRFSAILLAGTMLAAAQQAAAQSGEPQDKDQVVVKGQRMPGAEAPRSATCEALARDPHFAAQIAAAGGDPFMGPRVFLPTRLPRNPDYSAPPKVPAGSALPELPKSRFGVRSLVVNGLNGAEPGTSALPDLTSDSNASLTPEGGPTLESTVAACRAAYIRGGLEDGQRPDVASFPRVDSTNMENGRQFMASPAQRFANGRATIVANDKTLPMAFALFDQGRYAESLGWFRKAADKLSFGEGGDEARLFVGKLYLQGLGAKSNPVEGVKWLKKAASAPFNPVTETPIFDPLEPDRNTAVGEAAVILANVYRNGFPGIAKDPAQARKWYARAIEVGHLPAAKVLGDLYYFGIDTPRDVKKAAGYYRQAAKYDYAPAQVALAQILYQGEDGVGRDREAALQWFRAAARHDHPDALYALARAYDLGEGVKADPQAALGFYKDAALNGSAAAKAAMGTYFYEGKLVPKDDAAARHWFEAAAAGSDADGMVNLAAMMVRGEGGQKDLPDAWVWLKRASTAGHAAAPQAVAALERRMSPAEREAAAAKLTRR